ncbi:MAG: DUF934 domain-containing protein [Alphaproteobacteria bacterium]|nr:DUF934 domain-containing protein [Alphaproteobacteria bacterium]
MPLIKDKQFVDDPFTQIDDQAALPDSPVIVSLARLQTEAQTLAARNQPLGVIIRADNIGKTKAGENVRDLTDYLPILSLVALEFPEFRNGRGFSAARILRDELHFTGEIRAVGEVAFDQWAFMMRCGINAFEVGAHVTLAQFSEALGELSKAYQPACDDKKPILWRR